MTIVVFLACAPLDSAENDERPVSIAFEDREEIKGVGEISFYPTSEAISDSFCLAGVQIDLHSDEIELGHMAFPEITAGARTRSRPGDAPDRYGDDGWIAAHFNDGIRRTWHGLLTVESTASETIEISLTEGVLCTTGDVSEMCEPTNGSLQIQAPVDLGPNPYSTAPGQWENDETAQPYCAVDEYSEQRESDAE